MGWLSDFASDTWDDLSNPETLLTGGLNLVAKSMAPDAPGAPGAPADPTTDPAAIKERDRKTREEALRRLLGGQDSTIATSPMGLASAAPVATKSLLGA